MPYYNTCSLCGATLDPGENCTCEQDAKRKVEEERLNKMVKLTASLIKQSKPKRRKRK